MRFLLLRTFFFSSKALHPTVVDRCLDRHFFLCPVVGGNSPRKFRPFLPRIKIPSWMHSELHFPAVNHPGAIIYRKCRTFLYVQWSAETRLENSVHSFRALRYLPRSSTGARTVTFLCVQWSAKTRLENLVHSFRAWMHSELHSPAVNIQRPVLPQKMQNRQHNCHVKERQHN
jgi:hypothetical protein